jgi:hypoxia up-regulated 1
LAWACFALLWASAHSRLMAVDLGGEFLKVSVVAPGRIPISIVINEMSRRKTQALVGFVQGQRVLGEEATTLAGRQPDKFVKLLRDMIGKPADDPSLLRMLEDNLLQYDIVPDEDRGSIRIRIPGVERPFLIEELVVCIALIYW